MKKQWEKIAGKIDNMPLRERGLIFAAAALVLVMLIKASFLDPLLVQQKKLSSQISGQQEKIKELQDQIEIALQAKRKLQNSAEQHRLEQAKQELTEGNAYLQNRRDRLVDPKKMAELMERVLDQNGRLQLVNLRTLPVALLVVKTLVKPDKNNPSRSLEGAAMLDKQVFKHGVTITVRGSYLDLLSYLTELEKLPMQMFWGKAEMNVVRYPEVELTLTVYTLSLEKTWMQI